jgi:PAS domain S-box-containing protein
MIEPSDFLEFCLQAARAMGRAGGIDAICATVLDLVATGLSTNRAAVLLTDDEGVPRFRVWRGLSDAYRARVEGETPWSRDALDPEPLDIPDVYREPRLERFRPVFQDEGIAALTFVPLVSAGRPVGRLMLYRDMPGARGANELQLARVLAAQAAFAIERTQALEQARRSEERLRFALDAASMGTWDWDLRSNTVRWSENLEALHGLPPGTFDHTLASYVDEIHPDDRPRVLASAERALSEGVPHDVEYRIVAPDGSIRWCEGKGRVEYEDGVAVRMSGVCMIVTRRKEAELARLAAAEEAARLKDEFLATLSHELRTPLSAIIGWHHLLVSGQLAPERAAAAIATIGRNAALQARLIDDILDVSRIISGKLEIDHGVVSVRSLIDGVIEAMRPQAAAAGIALETRLDEGIPPIAGDARRLHQVLGNLVSNAIKFTPEGGVTEISCRVEDGSVAMAVHDSGVGIAPEFLPFVFDRFRQADSRATRRHGGLGLGLAIAKHLVEQHGGSIEARSEGAGRGTTVTVRLPHLPVTDAAPDTGRADPDPLADPLRLDGELVAVVDDHPDAREWLATFFGERGASVEAYEDASSALEGLARRPASLLVADIGLPGVDGLELLRRARAAGCTTPAVAVTAYARPEDRAAALDAGYAAYCPKPVDPKALLQAVRAARVSLQP